MCCVKGICVNGKTLKPFKFHASKVRVCVCLCAQRIHVITKRSELVDDIANKTFFFYKNSDFESSTLNPSGTYSIWPLYPFSVCLAGPKECNTGKKILWIREIEELKDRCGNINYLPFLGIDFLLNPVEWGILEYFVDIGYERNGYLVTQR